MPGNNTTSADGETSKIDNKKLISDLRVSRGTVTMQQTKLKNYIETPNRTMSLFELETRLGLLEGYMVRFNEIQARLEVVDPDEINEDKRQPYEETYVLIKSKLLTLISQKQPRASLPETSFATLIKKSGSLPKIQIKNFSGNFHDWPDFHATFKTLVEDNEELTKIEKLAYLRGALDDAPLQVIGNIRLSDDGFNIAMELLKSGYENKRLIFQGHIRGLFNLNSAEKGSASQLRSLSDAVNSHIRALKSIATAEQIADGLLLQLFGTKIDSVTRGKWEEDAPLNVLPSWNEFSAFLDKRCQTLENTEHSQSNSAKQSMLIGPSLRNRNKNHSQSRKSWFVAAKAEINCNFCKGTNHIIGKCDAFIALSPIDRYTEAKRLNLCINCLKSGHSVKNCKSSRCRYCNTRHHTLLHRHAEQAVINVSTSTALNAAAALNTVTPVDKLASPSSYTDPSSNAIVMTSQLNSPCKNTNFSDVVLATAMVDIQNSAGEFTSYRALLDSGSSLHFVSERLVQHLRLKRSRAYIDVTGIGLATTSVNYKTQLVLRSRNNEYRASFEAFVLPKITMNQPSRTINASSWSIPSNIVLADPHFNTPGPVDLLIGANLFFEILAVGQIRLGPQLPILQKTLLGWVIAGGNGIAASNCLVALNKIEDNEDDLVELVKRFWELEEFRTPSHLSKANECQKHFLEHVQRDSTGRFWVRLPFQKSPELLGNSLDTAKRRFFGLENKLMKNPRLKESYTNFLMEYLKLGHMEKIAFSSLSRNHYILPHHCVVKPESSSTKVRVVFDASCKTSSGYSLNDVLMPGPVVQDDLYTILLRFRSYKYAITADISKMYRQVRVPSSDVSWQCILWRNSPQDPLDLYQLVTLTYGTSPASFLATECLNHLAREEQAQYPIGATVLKRDFYVDDMLSGADSLVETKQIQAEIIELLKSGGFTLTKWCSNVSELLASFDSSDLEKYLEISGSNAIKTLGMIWQPQTDDFRYNYQDVRVSVLATKRSILSAISRLFNPLGLLCPIIVKAKILLQKLWSMKLAWDESLPQNLHSEWIALYDQLKLIRNLKIPRYIFSTQAEIEIHSFADASMAAYGACVYIRCIADGSISCNLLTAKSKVAPLKTISIPRLELCAALLAAELTSRVYNVFASRIRKVYCWSDSTIVLAWISSPPSKWSVFISNRVSKIEELTKNYEWKHVTSTNNSADIVSRGAYPSDILTSEMWFNGPSYLQLPEHLWPESRVPVDPNPPEARKTALVLNALKVEDLIESSKFATSYLKLVNTFAYIFRFYKNAKIKSEQAFERSRGPLTVQEFDFALRVVIRLLQKRHLFEEYVKLIAGKHVSSCSALKNLDPFIDSGGLIRVGGRLRNSDLDYGTKHPIILPKSNFTKALITHYHFRNLHAGTQTLLGIIRTRFWPMSGKTLVKKTIRNCVRCFRLRPKVMEQIMGQLPPARVQPSPVFCHTGIDFCGPFYIKNAVRNRPPTKAYVCLFICLAVKAVHLEVAHNLTTESFISALRKFISRRPHVSVIYSDNATNFVGAARELKELRTLFLSEQDCKLLHEMCRADGIGWKFIPPRSPHFGGLWEAAIKQAKYHMRRILGSEAYSLDELQTVTCQVEAILNSRPLTPQSEDTQDLRILTPGHFLTGGQMAAIPEPDFSMVNVNFLGRWQNLQARLRVFWTRWQRDYLQTLQSRNKWQTPNTDLKVGALVLLKDDNLPPLKWPLGRIVEIIQGKDGHVRVVMIKTMAGLVKRAITKVCLLPIDEKEPSTSFGSHTSKVAG